MGTVCIPLHARKHTGYVALIDEEDLPLVSQHRWYPQVKKCTVYAVSSRYENGKWRHFQMHRLIMGEPQGIQIDHEDGNGLNNRRYNLRRATHYQNMANRRKDSDSSAPYKGIHETPDGKWTAHVYPPDRKRIYLGRFPDALSAARAYDGMAREVFGEFAGLNFPDEIHPVPPGVKSRPHVLNRELAAVIRERRSAGEMIKSIARDMGASAATISGVVNGKTWK